VEDERSPERDLLALTDWTVSVRCLQSQLFFSPHRCAKHKMWTIVTDVPQSVGVSVCLSVGHYCKSCCRKRIEVPFGIWTRV